MVGFEMKYIFIVFLLFIPTPSIGEFYFDLGITYLDQLELTETASITFEGLTLSAKRNIVFDVDGFVPMLRVGYLNKIIGLEYEYIGNSRASLNRINLYHRFTFK